MVLLKYLIYNFPIWSRRISLTTLIGCSGIRSNVFLFNLHDIIIKEESNVKNKQGPLSSQTPQTYFGISFHGYRYFTEKTFPSKIVLWIGSPYCFIHWNINYFLLNQIWWSKLCDTFLNQKKLFTGVIQKSCSDEFQKFYRKIAMQDSLL